eukprot:5472926-Prymnesium_polylepis.1
MHGGAAGNCDAKPVEQIRSQRWRSRKEPEGPRVMCAANEGVETCWVGKGGRSGSAFSIDKSV